ncbi:hypothetical protein [Rasiella sp. SM2506]|uniref:hypothetical protein n=1 Tax=Rasiella sp. SM2506 TaxID=3423914 RepID=UPI003D7BBFD9
MKNLVLIAFALFTCTLSAQSVKHERKGKKEMVEKMKDWTPEQKAELATKKLALDLNLTEAQQKNIYPIQLENIKDRAKIRATKEKKTELSSKELFDVQNTRLEKQIKTKEQFKTILTAEQFEKWDKKHPRNKRTKRGKRSERK